MAAPKKLPDRLTLAILRDKGWRMKDIAAEYGVSETAVWKALNKGGLTNQYTYRDYLPWEIDKKHQTAKVMVHFRNLVRQRNGEEVDSGAERRLARWLQDLEDSNVVVAYHVDAPPNPASSSGGFYYVPRQAGDRWIVRDPGSEFSQNDEDTA
jgi:hypothetical protein